jgi:Xaa-Pro aminopeptidase
MASESFEANLPKWLEAGKKVYTLSPEIVKPLIPTRDVLDAKMPIARLRMKKSPAEIALIQRSTDVTIDGHLAAWKMMKPGLSEYQVAAAMMSVYLARDASAIPMRPS